MVDKTVRIGGASGFWGDSMVGAPQLLHLGKCDYLMFDYLAEVTMSIMAKARAKDPNLGYATDFVSVVMKRNLKDIAAKKVKIVANAGGTNPRACGEAVRALVRDAGLSLKVAIVEGDDLLLRLGEIKGQIRAMDPRETQPEQFMSMNAYFGGLPIAAALSAGADIVITGRCVDSAMALGILVHEFGWSPEEYDRLSQASLCGHILECGAQATGGLFTDWRDVPDWDNIGYPIAEVNSDGSFVVSKPEGTGGLVSFGTVAEQLVYEIGDTSAYILPDVICDFTPVEITEVGENRVRVAGAKGRAPTPDYKVSATYMDGWRATGQLQIGGREAHDKAVRSADAILKRTRRIFQMANLGDYRQTHLEVLGSEATYGPLARAEALATREVMMRLTVTHAEKRALDIFASEIAPAGTSWAPGTTGGGAGRPKPTPIVRLFSCFVPKTLMTAKVELEGQAIPVAVPAGQASGAAKPARAAQPMPPLPSGPKVKVPLIRVAYARSGDKGNNSNIGVIARKPEYLAAIKAQLTTDAVKRYMSHHCKGEVSCYDLPGLHGMNFLLRDALNGGGMASLNSDPLGKAYGQMLLDFEIEVPAAWGLVA